MKVKREMKRGVCERQRKEMTRKTQRTASDRKGGVEGEKMGMEIDSSDADGTLREEEWRRRDDKGRRKRR